jgi:glutathione S-transferase
VEPIPRLITIPVSHYCEKARWALDRAGIPYREERHLQGLHNFSTLREARSDEVPVLITATEKLRDSTDILKWVGQRTPGLYPNGGTAEEWEEFFDRSLGPATRVWAYFHLLQETRLLMDTTRHHGLSRTHLALMPILFPLIKRLIIAGYQVTEPNSVKAAEKIQAAFDRVGAKLGEGSPYLCGDQFSAADLTFAALAAPAVYPAEYGVKLPSLEELPLSMQSQVRSWRKHPAGIYALELYRKHRSKL